MKTVTDLLLQFLPILLLIGVWVFFMRKINKAAPAISAEQANGAAQLEELRKLNQTLERVAIALEERRDA
jgi:ATP-dependent Zn protease